MKIQSLGAIVTVILWLSPPGAMAQVAGDSTAALVATRSYHLLVYADSTYGVKLWVTTSDPDRWSAHRSFEPNVVEQWLGPAAAILTIGDTGHVPFAITPSLPGLRYGVYLARQQETADGRATFALLLARDSAVERSVALERNQVSDFIDALGMMRSRSRMVGDVGARSDLSPALGEVRGLYYPTGLQNAGITGNAYVLYFIGADGRAPRDSVRIVYADHELFGRSVMESISSWSFEAATKAGNPAGVWVAQVVAFRLPPR